MTVCQEEVLHSCRIRSCHLDEAKAADTRATYKSYSQDNQPSVTSQQTVFLFSSGFSIVRFVDTTVPLKQSVFL